MEIKMHKERCNLLDCYYFFHSTLFACNNSIWFVPTGSLTSHLRRWQTFSVKCSPWMLHYEYVWRCTRYLSTLRAHRLSTVMPTDAFCRKGISLHRKRPKKLLAKGQPIARSCTSTHTHINKHTHTHLQVSVTAHAGGVLSVELWDILVTVITATLCKPPNSDTEHTLPLFPQQISAAAVWLVKLETTFAVLGVQ